MDFFHIANYARPNGVLTQIVTWNWQLNILKINMKTIFQILFTIFISDCSAQISQSKIMTTQFTDKEIIEQSYQIKKADTIFVKNNKLDISKLVKEDGDATVVKVSENYKQFNHEVILNDGVYVYIRGNSLKGYQKTLRRKDAVFEDIYQYYPSGVIKMYGNFYINGFNNNIQYWFDEQGAIEKFENHDIPYEFGWKDVQGFLQEQKIKKEEIVEIHRSNGSGEYIWAIVFKPQELINTSNVKVFHLDAKTGEIIKEIIYSTARHLD
ncbi:hypothetical protein NQT66_09655 [Cellulophaga baltica]|uniref:hypothetical protein n=1 Tax=Cellulophaga TaxID=104264 RepID=UPI00051D3492|nr:MULTISPECIES: hypothetical protein [Cellulophaga]KGK29089.1 hypothetical protein EL45_17705 [Cellulophaga sp. E6(2014)]MCR1025070.1 hypothetical protein [Cellulophaga baltica]